MIDMTGVVLDIKTFVSKQTYVLENTFFICLRYKVNFQFIFFDKASYILGFNDTYNNGHIDTA